MAAFTVVLWMIFRFVLPFILLIGIGTWLERKQAERPL